jgi:hypothetical protein
VPDGLFGQAQTKANMIQNQHNITIKNEPLSEDGDKHKDVLRQQIRELKNKIKLVSLKTKEMTESTNALKNTNYNQTYKRVGNLLIVTILLVLLGIFNTQVDSLANYFYR